MSEMVKRVADAIRESMDSTTPMEGNYEVMARAAIEALRVPTGDMIVSGAKLDNGKNYAVHALAIYPKMIEAALK
jgi:hypothetical protein